MKFNKHFSTPIATYIFIKNGIKIDELKGAQPRQFEQLIDKHLKKKLRCDDMIKE